MRWGGSSHRGTTRGGRTHPPAHPPHHPCQTMSPRIVGRAQVRLQRPKNGQPAGRFMITQRVAWRDVHTPKGERRGTVAAVALSKTDDGQLAYQYLIAGGDGLMYLRWDHQLLRPSDEKSTRSARAGPWPSAAHVSAPAPARRPLASARRVRTSSRGFRYSALFCRRSACRAADHRIRQRQFVAADFRRGAGRCNRGVGVGVRHCVAAELARAFPLRSAGRWHQACPCRGRCRPRR